MPAQAALSRGQSLGSMPHLARGIDRPSTWTNPPLAQAVEAGNAKEHHQPDLRSEEQAEAARKEQSVLRVLPQAHRR
jgi:hypothetical protein